MNDLERSVVMLELIYDAQRGKKILMSDANSERPDERAFPYSLIRTLCLSTYTASTDFVIGQQRPWSAYANVQTGLGLRCPQIT